MSAEWMYLSEAYEHVRGVVGNDEEAKNQLLRRLRWGEVKARCESGESMEPAPARSPDELFASRPSGVHRWRQVGPIEPDYWAGAEVDYDSSSVAKHFTPEMYDILEGVHVTAPDVLRLWPASAPLPEQHRGPEIQKPLKPPRSNPYWAEAAAFMAAYLDSGGMPEKNQQTFLVDKLRQHCLDRLGNSYDERNLDDFVRRVREIRDALMNEEFKQG